MIEDFDHTLEKLLQLEFGKPLPFDLSFTAPDREFRPVSTTNSTLNCYLYEIGEDRLLRNLQPELRRNPDGTLETQHGPSRIKLSYCITAWSPAAVGTGHDPVLDEHALLSSVMVALMRYPVLPSEALTGNLADVEPVPTATLFGEALRSRDFWNAIGGTLRPALDYTATVSVPFDKGKTGPMVSMLRFTVGKGAALYVIGGTVRTAGTPPMPVAGAWVRLQETAATTVAGDDGSFSFGSIREGSYTLVARAVGFQERVRTVNVPGGDYDLELTGL